MLIIAVNDNLITNMLNGLVFVMDFKLIFETKCDL